MNTSNNKTVSDYHFLTREDIINLLEQNGLDMKEDDLIKLLPINYKLYSLLIWNRSYKEV